MIRDASRHDLPLIHRLLERANDAPYDIGAVVEEKCFGEGFSGPPRVRIYGEVGLAVTCGKHLRLIAVDRAERRRGIGSALLADSGATIAAAEPGNYFTPGVHEQDAGTLAFLRRHGFSQTSATWNLHVAIRAGESHAAVETGDVNDALIGFVRREFGDIWAFEASRARRVAWIPDVGFAAVEANNPGLGTFGPTGVARRVRGRGYGRALLLAALGELGTLGYERAVIPWTEAVDFYRKSCGAEPAHRFLILSRRLPPPR